LNAELGADVSLNEGLYAALSLSADGQVLVFAAQKPGGALQLYMRRLDQLEAVPLPDTEGAHSPFFSPDGQWVAFNAGGKLKKVSVTGGAAIEVGDVPSPAAGGTWSEDGTTITFSPHRSAGLVRVSSDGGKPEPLTTLGEGQVTHRWPQMLPGGRGVLFTAHTRLSDFNDANLEVQPLPTGARKVVQRGAAYGRYLPSGHIVYIRDGTLFAAPFDLDRLELTNSAVPVL
jgi:serine/threonine-protein kinase